MGSGNVTLQEIIGNGGSENKLFGASVEGRAGSRERAKAQPLDRSLHSENAEVPEPAFTLLPR